MMDDFMKLSCSFKFGAYLLVVALNALHVVNQLLEGQATVHHAEGRH